MSKFPHVYTLALNQDVDGGTILPPRLANCLSTYISDDSVLSYFRIPIISYLILSTTIYIRNTTNINEDREGLKLNLLMKLKYKARFVLKVSP